MSASQQQVQKMLGNKNNLSELKSRIWFVIIALVIFRLGSYIPVPGVNPKVLSQLLESQSGGLLDMFNMFSGGALGRFSLFALGVMPYITASIIIQILTHSVAKLKELKKEGESGRKKITQYTRYATVFLASFQAYAISFSLQQMGNSGGVEVVPNPGFGFLFPATIALTGGTVFLMWLGEQITERGIGNGISLIIFAGIVVGLPSAIGSTFSMVSEGNLNALVALFFLVLALAVTYFVVFVERAQRRITMQYARRGGRMGTNAQSSYLPLKVNMSGVIPVIFASSLVMFPGTIAQFLGQSDGWGWLLDISQWLSPGNVLYMIFFGGLIVWFAFFYTALTFDPNEISDNLKRSSAVIPGIRPGRSTADYIDSVTTKITFWGALYLLGVSLMPQFVLNIWAIPFALGGTGLLIVVVVAMDFMAQLQTHLMSGQYDNLMKKSNLKNYGKSGIQKR
ncbi:Protein translocase subunit SecY [hydrothermal vent metagenome]|uniref:Protein translocase subunit SecY n=1 Tax=hydrothermal vent metagenome TaxID=652676 RepID=A0A3B0W6Y1_9ZZZZ